MNYDQFVREERSRYELFAKIVVGILQSAIDAEPRDFRLQQITHRAKDPVSLERKLTERGLIESNSIEQELKDLAGCRLIFYTNTDVDRFLNSRLIFENFVVDFDGSKIHHAVGTERSADELYFRHPLSRFSLRSPTLTAGICKVPRHAVRGAASDDLESRMGGDLARHRVSPGSDRWLRYKAIRSYQEAP